MKKFLVLLLALMMLALPLLCACGNESTGDSSVAESDTASESANNGFPLEKKVFNKTLTVLVREKRFAQQFIPYEEYEGSVINVAVKNRNDFIEEEYGIKLETEIANNPVEALREAIAVGTKYDMVADSVYRMVPLVVENLFLSVNDLLELNRPWWDQNANNYLTLSDKVFFVAGDMLFTDDLYTACVIFNKTEYDLYFKESNGSLYDAVREHRWNYNMLYSLAKEYARADENGDWMTEGAYYGIVTDGYTGSTMLVNGSGVVTASKDDQNNIMLNVGTERCYAAFDRVFEMLMDGQTSAFVEQYPNGTGWSIISNQFISGHALFNIGYLSSLLEIKESLVEGKVTPGVLPIPLYDDSQEQYYCGVNAYQSTVVGIPVDNIENLEATCYLMELLGYYSSASSSFGKDSVTSAFYETTMKLQSVETDDDSEMMDLVKKSRIYDIGGIFDWGGNLIGVFSKNMYDKSNKLASTWNSIQISVEQAMNDTIEAYRKSIT